jgi:hypothetical protein
MEAETNEATKHECKHNGYDSEPKQEMVCGHGRHSDRESAFVVALRGELLRLVQAQPLGIHELNQIGILANHAKAILQALGHPPSKFRGATGAGSGSTYYDDGLGGITLGPPIADINLTPTMSGGSGNTETYGATVMRELKAVVKSLADRARTPSAIIREMGAAKSAGLDDVYAELKQELDDLRSVKKRAAGQAEGVMTALAAGEQGGDV